MFDYFNRLRGSAGFTVCGAFPEGFLNMCTRCGIEILAVQHLDCYTLRVTVPYSCAAKVEAAAEKCMCTLSDRTVGGSTRYKRLLLRRLVPAVCAALLIALLVWSKLYVWEISVVGNENVPTGDILDALDECGVGIGSFWPNFTSDNIRSEVVLKMPELAWITVNMYGSRAEVIVRERTEKPEMISEDEPADILAEKTGMITKIQALIGTQRFKTGQAVIKGEMLISGGVESPFAPPRLLHAYGEITARTYYELTAEMPSSEREKVYTGAEKRRLSIVIGEKRINFYGNSSISDGQCDKIITEYKCEVEGVFSLPVSLLVETGREYEVSETPRDALYAKTQLENELHNMLLDEIGSGSVEYENYTFSEKDGVIICCLRAECIECIGVTEPMSDARISEIQNSYTEGKKAND